MNEQMEWTDFLHADANSGKQVISMILGWCDQKWVLPFSLWDPKICFILRMILWIELIFYMLTVIQ